MVRELLSKQNIDFMERAREVAETHVRPIAAQHDVEQTYPWAFQKAIKDAGLSGVWIPREYGGAGGSVLDLCLVVEQISRACGGMGGGPPRGCGRCCCCGCCCSICFRASLRNCSTSSSSPF